ncbi:MAG: ATP-binding protein [Deltaproteobacteria bacterium]|nr:ATP-binding protein [Deltaproteobacteria bacterium]
MWINRSYQKLIVDAAKTRPALVLTGARQTGKTSLLLHLFPNLRFVTLDLPSEAEQAEKDAELFLQRYPPPVIIDEVQYAPSLFRFIKIYIDKNRDQSGMFFLTGSQKFILMKSVGDSLAGRIELLELEPLSLREVRNGGLDWGLEDVVFRGGFPELYRNPEISVIRFFSAFVASYLERDVKGILNVSNLRDFERFLRACALRSGQVLNKNELAKDVGISPSTAGAWLSVLEASGQVALLEPWFSNKTKSLIKSPKLYLTDSGLMNFLLNIDSKERMLSSPFIGSIWETFVFSELRKLHEKHLGTWKWNFWADRSREVDFLSDRGGRFTLYEAKWNERPEFSDTDHLRFVIRILNPDRIDQAGVICRTRVQYPISATISALPLDSL